MSPAPTARLREVAVAFLTQEDVELYGSSQLREAPAGLAGLIYKKTATRSATMLMVVTTVTARVAMLVVETCWDGC